MAKAQSPRRQSPRRKRTLGGIVLQGALMLAVWGAIFLVAFFAVFAANLPDTSGLYEVKRQPSISYLDRSGALMATRGSQYAPPVNLDTLPDYVPQAFIAIEDRWYYWHVGFNPWGIARSQIYNMTHRGGGPLRGGSTITQQLARNLFLTPNQNYRRKAQELVLAVWLEAKFTKKQILELYLNRVYFGAGAYGIEAAAQRYFGKPATQLTLGESATLAGLMKGPSHYSPIASTERAALRANLVLTEMVRARFITAEDRAAAIRTPVRVNSVLSNQRAQYFVDWIDEQTRRLTGQPTEDLVVETTLDLPLQSGAEQAVRRGVAAAASVGVEQAALISLDGEGRIRAYVGGVSYLQSQFDRATLARRQAGSAFKPFVYLTAMEAGRTPDTPVIDEPLKIGTWAPRNYTGQFLGPITLQTALAQSVNTVAARLAEEVGTANVAATARRLGITSNIQLDPSMALGAVEVSPLEMAQAYAPFANGGALAKGYGVERIRTSSGRVLYDHSVDQGPRQAVIGQPALAYMIRMLRQVVAGGTGARAAVSGYDLAGKTGTTSDYRDAWFVGFTGGFVTAVWVGKDDNKPMRRVTGGGPPAAIWRDYMTGALPRLKVQPIPGGELAQAPGMDPIGTILDGVTELLRGDQAAQPPPPDPGDAPPPSRKRDEPTY